MNQQLNKLKSATKNKTGVTPESFCKKIIS